MLIRAGQQGTLETSANNCSFFYHLVIGTNAHCYAI